jgi:histidine phosphotransfer protein HptB
MTIDPELSNLLNIQTISDLRSLGRPGGPDIFAELIEMFLREVPARLSGMRASLDQKDPQTLMQEAHRFKGSCQQMGAPRLAGMCYELEQIARSKLLVDSSKVDEIEQEAARVCRALIATKNG